MEVLESTLQITFDDVMLLSFDDYMRAEPKFASAQLGETVTYVRARFGTQLQPTIGLTNTISFSVLRHYDDPADAREAAQEILASMPTGIHDALIENLAGGSRTLKGARLLPSEPEIVDAVYVAVNYQLIGGELTGPSSNGYDGSGPEPDWVFSGGAPDTSFALDALDGGTP